jgi:heme oxygenase
LIITERLKASTALAHQKLEKSVLGLIQELQTSKDYGNLLGLFYSYFGGLESLIDVRTVEKYLPDYNERRKSLWLLEDLLHMKKQHPEICLQTDLPLIKNPYQALGALYVMEGSTLGGVYIIKMIQRKIPGNGKGFHFFTGYGDRNALMWDRFKNALDHATTRDEDILMIISGAEMTFHSFYEWIKKNQHGNH